MSRFDVKTVSLGRLYWVRVQWAILAALLGFALALALLPVRTVYKDGLLLLLGIATALLAAWMPGLWRQGISYRGQLLITGICGTWIMIAVWPILTLLYWDDIKIAAGPNEWLLYTVLAAMGFGLTAAGICHVAAPGAFNGQVPDRQWGYIGAGLGLAVGLWLWIA